MSLDRAPKMTSWIKHIPPSAVAAAKMNFLSSVSKCVWKMSLWRFPAPGFHFSVHSIQLMDRETEFLRASTGWCQKPWWLHFTTLNLLGKPDCAFLFCFVFFIGKRNCNYVHTGGQWLVSTTKASLLYSETHRHHFRCRSEGKLKSWRQSYN